MNGITPNYDHWRKIATIKTWELAALMQGYDPRALSDVVVETYGEFGKAYVQPPDFSSDKRIINSAACAGLIQATDPNIELEGSHTKIVVSSLGNWLTSLGHENLAESLGLIPPTQAQPQINQSNHLATRDELIFVFGKFTGMHMKWFDALKDKPALKEARKQMGRGQRGKATEPLFCPYEVMLWLINPKRKAGTPLSKEKGWELLEKHFPSAYNGFSIGDPRPNTD